MQGCRTHREMLEEPRSEDVGRHLGEDASFLLILLACIVVFLACALAAAYTRITRITCGQIQPSTMRETTPRFLVTSTYM